jgi:hypothetical protein
VFILVCQAYDYGQDLAGGPVDNRLALAADLWDSNVLKPALRRRNYWYDADPIDETGVDHVLPGLIVGRLPIRTFAVRRAPVAADPAGRLTEGWTTSVICG